jgi:hypothetical protein
LRLLKAGLGCRHTGLLGRRERRCNALAKTGLLRGSGRLLRPAKERLSASCKAGLCSRLLCHLHGLLAL